MPLHSFYSFTCGIPKYQSVSCFVFLPQNLTLVFSVGIQAILVYKPLPKIIRPLSLRVSHMEVVPIWYCQRCSSFFNWKNQVTQQRELPVLVVQFLLKYKQHHSPGAPQNSRKNRATGWGVAMQESCSGEVREEMLGMTSQHHCRSRSHFSTTRTH